MNISLIGLFNQIRSFPTPVAGLALGIASIGMVLDTQLDTHGLIQLVTASISAILLAILVLRFIFHPNSLLKDLKHPVIGSVAPTFSMALMLVSNAIIKFQHEYLGHILWLIAVTIHVIFLLVFIYHRMQKFNWEHMIPSWFVPPVGIIVASVSYQGEMSGILFNIAQICLYFGLLCYAVMLPLMFYRIVFKENIQQGAQPTIAILAAPASLSITGYLSLIAEPSVLVILLLFGIAVLMTFIVYVSFARLLFLPFTPGFAAFTFPMAIGATALYKTADQLEVWGVAPEHVNDILLLANIELVLATLVISYVTVRFVHYFLKAVPNH